MRRTFLVGRMGPETGRVIVVAEGDGGSPIPGPFVLMAVIRPPDPGETIH